MSPLARRLAIWVALVATLSLSLGAPARASSPSDGTWRIDGPPSPRFGQTAIYDPVRDRMIVFGGTTSVSGPATVMNEVWTWNLGSPAPLQLADVAGTPPPGRYMHTMIYDPVRDRVLVFGGNTNASSLNDVWALSLSAPLTWTQLSPTGSPPSARYGQASAYDPVGDRMIVFGGTSGAAFLNDLWSLSLSGVPTWAPLTPVGTPPGKRSTASLVLDPARQKLVLYGGYDGSYLNDAWGLSLTGSGAWAPITASAALPARGYHTATFDAARDEMLVFGGYDGAYRNDAFVLSFDPVPHWTPLTTAGTAPQGRSLQSMVHDPLRDREIVFSGVSSIVLGDLWTLSDGESPTWTLMQALTPRSSAAMARDPVRDRLILFGGINSGSNVTYNDVFSAPLADLSGWSPLAFAGMPPGPRSAASIVYDPVRDRMLVFGGKRVSPPGPTDELWELSLSGVPTWTQLFATGSPGARFDHSAIYDPVRDRMIVFGGLGSVDPRPLVLSLGSMTWAFMDTQSPPPGPIGQSAFYDPVRDRAVVHGGGTGTWALDLAASPNTWEPLASRGFYRDREEAVYDAARHRLVVFGGSQTNNETWALDLRPGGVWTQLQPDGSVPPGRYSASAAYDPVRDRMLIACGSSSDGASHNDLAVLQWSPAVDGVPTLDPGVASFRPPRPNPSRGGVELAFQLPRASWARLRLYDVHGRIVRTLVDGVLPAGPNVVQWDRLTVFGDRAAPGLYFFELKSGDLRLTRRVSLTD